MIPMLSIINRKQPLWKALGGERLPFGVHAIADLSFTASWAIAVFARPLDWTPETATHQPALCTLATGITGTPQKMEVIQNVVGDDVLRVGRRDSSGYALKEWIGWSTSPSNPLVYVIRHDAGFVLRQNGIDRATVAAGTFTASATTFAVGCRETGSNAWDGDVHALLFRASPSLADLDAIAAEFLNRYN